MKSSKLQLATETSVSRGSPLSSRAAAAPRQNHLHHRPGLQFRSRDARPAAPRHGRRAPEFFSRHARRSRPQHRTPAPRRRKRKTHRLHSAGSARPQNPHWTPGAARTCPAEKRLDRDHHSARHRRHRRRASPPPFPISPANLRPARAFFCATVSSNCACAQCAAKMWSAMF